MNNHLINSQTRLDETHIRHNSSQKASYKPKVTKAMELRLVFGNDNQT